MTPKRQTLLSPLITLLPAVYSANSTSAVLDMYGFNAAALALTIGVGGIAFDANNRIDFILSHGAAADGSDMVPVPDIFLAKDSLGPTTVVNGIVRSLIAAHAAADVQRVHYLGGLRYLQLKADFTGVHGTGTAIAASIIRTRPAVSA